MKSNFNNKQTGSVYLKDHSADSKNDTNTINNKPNLSNKIQFLNNFYMFESASILKKENITDKTFKPSDLKEFQKEKLELICKNKIKDQIELKDSPNRSFLNHEFQKNIKTGEYEASKESIDLITKKSIQNLSENNKVKMMIKKFENIASNENNKY